MRTKITATTGGYVTVAYYSEMAGERVTRTFFCPDGGGGYVHESTEGYPQVCEKLGHRGITLICGRRDDALIALIRREYRAMRRDERQDRLG